MRREWESFREGIWEKEINVRDFIQKNYTPYEGDESFLSGPTKATSQLWDQVLELMKQINRDGTTVILITHDNGIASQARRIVRVMDGKILCDSASGGRPLEVVS